MTTYKKIPYAIASYKTIRQEEYYYVDKTSYLADLEAMGTIAFP